MVLESYAKFRLLRIYKSNNNNNMPYPFLHEKAVFRQKNTIFA